MKQEAAMTIGELFPALASELETALVAEERSDLAVKIRTLPVLRRCCTDAFCSSFFTANTTSEEIGQHGARLIPAGDVPGLTCLFLLDGEVCFVELLNRKDVRDALDKVFS